jgi:TRAP-type C4-dicarboxylate transport system permease large subunit
LPLEKIIKASVPWIGLIAISLVIFILFPQIIEVPVGLVFGS